MYSESNRPPLAAKSTPRHQSALRWSRRRCQGVALSILEFQISTKIDCLNTDTGKLASKKSPLRGAGVFSRASLRGSSFGPFAADDTQRRSEDYPLKVTCAFVGKLPFSFESTEIFRNRPHVPRSNTSVPRGQFCCRRNAAPNFLPSSATFASQPCSHLFTSRSGRLQMATGVVALFD